ncbi:MAG: radical SAM-associated putative lipoprotein [Bacteroidota bacterium]
MRYIYKTFSILCVLLGISSFVAAQYGAPVSTYKLIGSIKTIETKKPVSDIRVTLKAEDGTTDKTIQSDSAGNFNFIFSDYFSDSKLKIIAEDIDGEINGEYETSETLLSVNKSFFDENRGAWNKYNKEPLMIYLSEKIPTEAIKNENTKNQKKYQKNHPITGGDKRNKIQPVAEEDNKSIMHDPIQEYDEPIIVQAKNTEDVIKIKIFPNPNSGNFNVDISTTFSDNIDIKVFDIKKQLISEKNFSINNENISTILDLSDYSNGVYLIEIKTNDNLYTSKIIKK